MIVAALAWFAYLVGVGLNAAPLIQRLPGSYPTYELCQRSLDGSKGDSSQVNYSGEFNTLLCLPDDNAVTMEEYEAEQHCRVRGDLNCDGTITASEVQCVTSYYSGKVPPAELMCPQAP